MMDSRERPPVTPEEELKLLQFLSELSVLRDADPGRFKEVAQQLGIAGDEAGLESLDLSSLTQSIRAMKSPGSDGAAHDMDSIKLPHKADEVKSITITPEPGFTVKTKTRDTGIKVYINVCVHADISQPSKKKKLNDAGEEVEGLNVPMSVGPARSVPGKQGTEVIVHDVIVHPRVIEETAADTSGKYRDFVCHLCLQCLEQKFAYALDPRYRLPALLYKGTVESQRIQDRSKAPSIEEVEARQPARPPVVAKPVLPASDALPVVRFLWRTEGGAEEALGEEDAGALLEYAPPLLVPRDKRSLVLAIALPAADPSLDPASISVSVSAFRLRVRAPGFREVHAWLPFEVLPATCVCSMGRALEERLCLTVRVEVHIAHGELGAAADPGSRPWLLSHALADAPYAPCETNTMSTPAALPDRPSDEGFAEDRFHISLPSNVDQYTGARLQEEELPEDRFHRSDAASAHLLEQRAKAAQDKADKYERERHERVDDPNVEYIDFDDFRKGGKKSSPEASAAGERLQLRPGDDAATAEGALDVRTLSSSLWADLL